MKKLTAFVLAFIMAVSTMSMVSYAADSLVPVKKTSVTQNDIGIADARVTEKIKNKASAVKVSDAASLEKALTAKSKLIEITADFEIDRTFYVDYSVTIFSQKKCVMKRKADFTGDIFVIGETKSGRNVLLDNVSVTFNLGDPSGEEGDMLIIDGNAANMKKAVSGTVIFVCGCATVNLFKNVSIINCKKTANSRSNISRYCLPYTDRIGGAGAIIASGVLNLYGAAFRNNVANDEIINDKNDDTRNKRTSSLGGAIFNYATLRVIDGSFENNHAARGGAVYNYRIVKLYNALFESNSAQKYGGAIYQAESQYGEIVMGSDGALDFEGGVNFISNSAAATGGAIFSQTKNCLLIYEDANAVFENNSALGFNGGAISAAGTCTVYGATFRNNTAKSKGGAVYVPRSDDKLITRLPVFKNTVFEGNTAARGGALASMSKDDNFESGGNVTIEGCEFVSNSAVQDAAKTETSINGGAIYLSRKSTAKITDTLFSGNTSLKKGGAIYITGETNVTLDKCEFTSNKALDDAEGNGGAVAIHGSRLDITECTFNMNESARHGGAVYISYNNTGSGSKAAKVFADDSAFTSNKSGYHGGAVYVTSKGDGSDISYYETASSKYEGNEAKENGGALYYTKSKGYVLDSELTSNKALATQAGGGGAVYMTNSAAELENTKLSANESSYNGGALALYTGSVMQLKNVDVKNNTASTQGGAAYINKSLLNVFDSSFEENESLGGGGAVSVYTSAVMNAFGSSFSNNTAARNGGGVYVTEGANAYLSKCEVNSNTAGGNGGGVYVHFVSDGGAGFTYAEICDSQIISNSAVNGGGLYATKSPVYLKNDTFDSNYANAAADENGKRYGGGAIYLTGSNSDADNLTLTNNTSDYNAGAIALYSDSKLNINKSAASGNTASTQGGAVYVNKSVLNAFECTFSENSALSGGGAVSTYTDAQSNIISSGFNGNTASKNGGAVYYSENANGYIENSTFTLNKSGGNGGAAAVYGSQLSINGGSFTENESTEHAGALYISYNNLSDGTDEASKVAVKGVSFSGNNSGYHGGAIYVTSKDDSEKISYLNLSSSVLEKNEAASNGGALYVTKSAAFIRNTDFIKNAANNAENYGGGAIYSTTGRIDAKDVTFTENRSEYNGGAVALYSSSSAVMSSVTANGNTTATQGGAFYLNKSVLDLADSELSGNSAESGGGAVSTYTNAVSNIFDTVITENSAAKNGGALYYSTAEGAVLDSKINGNSAASNGGAFYISASTVYGENNEINENTSDSNGGAIYATGSTSKAEFNLAEIKKNVAKGGGAYYATEGAQAIFNDADISENSASSNGGAFYCYTNSATKVFSSTFENNTAVTYGGGIYASGACKAELYGVNASLNSGSKGGFIYQTTTGTEITANGLNVSGNKGGVVFGNTAKSIFNVSKSNYTDAETEVNDAYWAAMLSACASKLTIKDVASPAPEYTPSVEGKTYSHADSQFECEEKALTYAHEDVSGISIDRDAEYKHENMRDAVIVDTAEKTEAPVAPVFELAQGKVKNGGLSEAYDKLEKLDSSNNFMSRGTKKFSGINSKMVTVDTLVYVTKKPQGNPTVSEGILIYEAMLYKKAHPTKNVTIDISSYRFNIETAVCLNRSSRYFGYARNLEDCEYDEYGFVRISYLLVCAAKMGIEVTVCAQLDGYPKSKTSPTLDEYFTSHLSDPCDSAYAQGKTVADFMDYKFVYWTAYDNDAATDMMHTKVCAVSNYIDVNGGEHSGTIWFSSTNLDGIYPLSALNGNGGTQTGAIISDHDKMFGVAHNYIKLLNRYSGQEDVYEFREFMVNEMARQVSLIRTGNASKISDDELLVYLGTSSDDVFELYFTPFGGDASTWNEDTNPLCKYLRKLNESDGYIWLGWNNVKFNKNYQFALALESMATEAFTKNKNPQNRAYIVLPEFDSSEFEKLTIGKDIQYYSVGSKIMGAVHAKDMVLSYSENGVRYYVSLFNSMNLHQGAMSYQSNFALVIKEKGSYSNADVFSTFAGYSMNGVTKNDLKYITASLSSTSYVYNGKMPTVKLTNVSGNDYTVTYEKNGASVGKHTVTITGKGNYLTGTKKLTYTVKKADSKVTLKSKTAAYNGKAISIAKASVTGSTGKVTYTYYTDSACTVKTSVKKHGAKTKGSAPVKVGTYYVKAKVAADTNHNGAESKVVKLVIKKAEQTVKLQTTSKTIKASALKKSSQKFKLDVKVKYSAKVTFKQLSSKGGITVSETGKVKVPKSLKKGTYSVKVRIKVSSTANTKYKAVEKTIKVKVKG